MDSDSSLPLANVSDIPVGKSIVVVSPDGEMIALFNVDGKIFALNNACPHEEGPLGEGELEGVIVTCPWHGWQFDVTSGACQNMPGDDAKQIDIIVKEGKIFLAGTI